MLIQEIWSVNICSCFFRFNSALFSSYFYFEWLKIVFEHLYLEFHLQFWYTLLNVDLKIDKIFSISVKQKIYSLLLYFFISLILLSQLNNINYGSFFVCKLKDLLYQTYYDFDKSWNVLNKNCDEYLFKSINLSNEYWLCLLDCKQYKKK